ncbi:hypothetical protein LCGC14_2460140 [marine sediment metagenome]|uniref:Uncharacterized protein n=1 Tax=marine sediment metagenome TaxID=412755 RepID=A0A0F9DQL8_9ZZZZ|nr:hypothetical protein [Porticoccus sp.]
MQRFLAMQLLAMRRFLTLMLLLAASTISLTGCGNKGPLYLPPPPVQQISTPAEVSEEASEEAPVEASEETVESEDSSEAPEDSPEDPPKDAPEDSPENTEAAEEPETTAED